jgi:penicillin amidase
MRRVARYAGLTLLAAATVVAGSLTAVRLPLPEEGGSRFVSGLHAPVRVEFDKLGVPKITASDRLDAIAALGYVTARDRLFQMDLFRRSAAGRLAEIFGVALVKEDTWNRAMGFGRLAEVILGRLPPEQRDALRAYSSGVNQLLSETSILPLEFAALGYRPDPWRPEDSILVLLGTSTNFSYNGRQERVAEVMRRTLPPAVVSFLTPESDCYNEILSPRNPARCASDDTPYDELERLIGEGDGKRSSGLVEPGEAPYGSNAWVVARTKTRSGAAILANDMHMRLSVPNVWYRAELIYGSARSTGLTMPGLPMIVTGSNGALAWGFTSIEGDFSDFVRIESDPGDPRRYFSAGASLSFDERVERISVRGAEDVVSTVKSTIWGPVLPERFLGDEFAVRWTALDPSSSNFDLMDMDLVDTIESALTLFHRAGGPPLNVLIAGRDGRIAWTMMGRLPKRYGLDGLFSESWADGKKGWDGYLAPDRVPAIIDPASGFLVNTNQRMLGMSEFEPKIGHDFTGGFRAWRVNEALDRSTDLVETDMSKLQLDTSTVYYEYYRKLALSVLDSTGAGDGELRTYLQAWDGRAEPESLGLPLILEFRRALMDAVFSPILAKCRALDPTFVYWWSGADVPLQRIIESGRPGLLPDRAHRGDRRRLLRDILLQSARDLTERHELRSIRELSWGMTNRAELAHPLSGAAPLLGSLLDMPREPLAGCIHCVRFASGQNGASARMVVAPGRENEGILHMPAGQSGQFGSNHYGDQQADWVKGAAAPFRAEGVRNILDLRPAGP